MFIATCKLAPYLVACLSVFYWGTTPGANESTGRIAATDSIDSV